MLTHIHAMLHEVISGSLFSDKPGTQTKQIVNPELTG